LPPSPAWAAGCAAWPSHHTHIRALPALSHTRTPHAATRCTLLRAAALHAAWLPPALYACARAVEDLPCRAAHRPQTATGAAWNAGFLLPQPRRWALLLHRHYYSAALRLPPLATARPNRRRWNHFLRAAMQFMPVDLQRPQFFHLLPPLPACQHGVWCHLGFGSTLSPAACWAHGCRPTGPLLTVTATAAVPVRLPATTVLHLPPPAFIHACLAFLVLWRDAEPAWPCALPSTTFFFMCMYGFALSSMLDGLFALHGFRS